MTMTQSKTLADQFFSHALAGNHELREPATVEKDTGEIMEFVNRIRDNFSEDDLDAGVEKHIEQWCKDGTEPEPERSRNTFGRMLAGNDALLQRLLTESRPTALRIALNGTAAGGDELAHVSWDVSNEPLRNGDQMTWTHTWTTRAAPRNNDELIDEIRAGEAAAILRSVMGVWAQCIPSRHANLTGYAAEMVSQENPQKNYAPLPWSLRTPRMREMRARIRFLRTEERLLDGRLRPIVEKVSPIAMRLFNRLPDSFWKRVPETIGNRL